MTHPTDDEIMELAGAWFHTGENQKRDDGYYYRSLGTPSNVRGSDLIEFARALLAEQARTEPELRSEKFSLLNAAQPLKAEQAKDAAEDAEMLDWLTRKVSGKAMREAGVVWPAWSPEYARTAIRAAMAQER